MEVEPVSELEPGTHTPPEQDPPLLVSQVTPQLPQLLASLVTSTQVPLHAICGDAQIGWHWAAMH